ncbi:hypothetical protein [Rubinisphaera brasiliensis]|uniref:Lipoprotein n=1 Tax=Rubinisphaera brasiliensis (strain ATCC 49424 / DSM 5305 / JCM 21570 / IAM 15109 / NBRC 103401 / IFAM 1448) TaxID=756272 RepID=F0SKM3_RUBBR|nr:hypothetical protein [Rubinisphaera brasiliensis]ADY57641.1 hypothetical protein Plabr_0009 [Rubinisphaera brasiliensis DSM 5305]
MSRSVAARFVYSLLLTGLLLTTGCNDAFRSIEEPAKPAGEAKQEQAAAPVAEEKRPNLVKRKTQEVVDMQKAMAENPKLIEVENKINASDPLTASLQGYIAISSRANVLNFQHQVNIMKAAEDRNPTYQEIMNLIKQSNMEFNALPDYQTYAYDEKEGRFTILEDPEAKAAFEAKAKS